MTKFETSLNSNVGDEVFETIPYDITVSYAVTPFRVLFFSHSVDGPVVSVQVSLVTPLLDFYFFLKYIK